jgi:hypothetical protein
MLAWPGALATSKEILIHHRIRLINMRPSRDEGKMRGIRVRTKRDVAALTAETSVTIL